MLCLKVDLFIKDVVQIIARRVVIAAKLMCFFLFVGIPLLYMIMIIAHIQYVLQIIGLLFHRAILMSGSGLAPWSMVHDPAKYAAIVSHHVNCSPELPHAHLMKCLRERPLQAILSTPIRQPEFGNAFGPSIDGVVIGKFD